MEPTRPRSFTLAVVSLAAFGVGLLAFTSPADDSDADARLALPAAQLLLEQGTLDLRAADRADLGSDYRVGTGPGGEQWYASFGLPVLSLPPVWLARRAGLDLWRESDDRWLQNLLSAAACALLVPLLYALLRAVDLPPRAALLASLLGLLGSPLTSTLATAWWNQTASTPLLVAALLFLIHRRIGPAFGLGIVASLCRPASAFFVVALAAEGLGHRRRWLRVGVGVAMGIVLLTVVASRLDLLEAIPRYYAPRKLIGPTPLVDGLLGLLVSPSRGLFVYVPWTLLAVALAASRGSSLARNRVTRVAGLWIVLHLTAVATKQFWWGGHAFGPRLLAELVPPLLLLGASAWRDLPGEGSRRAVSLAFFALAVPSVAINTGLGLFAEGPRLWNERPDIDRHPDLLWRWSDAQLLAAPEELPSRAFEHERSHCRPYALGREIGPESPHAAFRGWSPPEVGWRWSDGSEATIEIVLVRDLPPAPRLLVIEAGTFGRQRVGVAVEELPLGSLELDGFAPTRHILLLPPRPLAAGPLGIHFSLPDAIPAPGDGRRLGVALRSLRLLDAPTHGVSWQDDALFLSGWSSAESSWRWTDGAEARLLLPLLGPLARPRLTLRAGAFGRQEVELSIGGSPLESRVLDGFEPRDLSWPLPTQLGPPPHLLEIELRTSSPGSPPGDPRELGLAFVSLRLEEEDAARPAGRFSGP